MDERPIVVILAAGLGTRIKSGRAKVLHEVAGRPLIAWTVAAARAAGAARILAVLGPQREAIEDLLAARFGAGVVETVVQRPQQGTGHAVGCALPRLESESSDRVVVILSGDVPLLLPARILELVRACAESQSGMALLSTTPAQPMAYGRLLRDASGRLVRIVEERDASEAERGVGEMNAGVYALRLAHLRSGIPALRPGNAKGELYLTDLAEQAAARGGAHALDVPFAEVRGVNDRNDLAAVDAEARRRINRALLDEGVTMVAPDQVFIDADVGPIGGDVWIAPQVFLRGTTSVGAGVRIDVGCVLTDVTIAADAWIKPYSVLSGTRVGERAHIGPFTHCRPDTQVDAEAKIGNFVETKKAHFMAGAKANHLAYLGDVSVGAKANIGAGTITCNYDGVNKYRTTIEAGAFIGSDSQLVAPVTVGRDAYVGSGTTVTKDVPRASLALSRVKQVNVEGWADRFREAQGKRREGQNKRDKE